MANKFTYWFFLCCIINILGVKSGRVCDFSLYLIENCQAVITESLTLQTSVLINVHLVLEAPSGEDVLHIKIPETATVHIHNSTIEGNTDSNSHAWIGFWADGFLSLSSTYITKCSGAIHSTGGLNITDCVFENNNGDAIGVNGKWASIKDSIFRYGSKAVHFWYTEGEISNCQFTSMKEPGYFVGLMSIHDSDVTIIGCEFSDNLAKNGAAVAIFTGNLTVIDCQFYHNEAIEGYGGAIYSEAHPSDVHITIVNSKFYSNMAVFGSSIATLATPPHVLGYYKSYVTLRNVSMESSTGGADIDCERSHFYLDRASFDGIKHIQRNENCTLEIDLPKV